MSEKNFYDDLLRHQLQTLSEKVPELEQAFNGNNLILNVCVAYSRKVAAENVELKDRLNSSEATIESLTLDIREMRVTVEANAEFISRLTERLDKWSEWAEQSVHGRKRRGFNEEMFSLRCQRAN